jgi:HSP20 family molecular chaperone IbpA
MKKYQIAILLFSSTLVLASDVDSMNLKSMYEGAEEVEMLNRSMEAGMQEHNQKVQPILTETVEHVVDNTPIEDFQELEDNYYLEKLIEDSKNAKVEVTISGDNIKIVTTVTKNKDNGTAETSYSSTTIEELPIPHNSNINQMKKEYKNGILTISIPKNKR